jgi:hypothetical protein
MRGGFGPRFVVEAIFLVAVATIAGLSQFPTEAIVLVMALAWLLVAGVEWALARADGSGMRRRRAESGEPSAQHVRVVPRDPDPDAQPVLVRRSEAMPEPELEAPPAPEPLPPAAEVTTAEPTPADEVPEVAPEVREADEEAEEEGEEVAATAEPEAERAQEPEPEPEPERPPLVAVAPEPEAEPERVVEPAEKERVVALPLPQTPREWNLWELERLASERRGADAERDEERSYLLMYLRDFASPEGTLPVDFDLLVRESFGELIETR